MELLPGWSSTTHYATLGGLLTLGLIVWLLHPRAHSSHAAQPSPSALSLASPPPTASNALA